MNLEDISSKQFRNISYLILGIMAVLFILSIFNIYPGGYSIKNENTETFNIEKTSFLNKENIEVTITQENELKTILLKHDITDLKIQWGGSIIVTLGFLFLLGSYIKNKKKNLFYITIVLFLIFIPLNMYLYLSKLNNIESYLSLLNLS
ncbi:MAG: hypothetical protein ABS938_00605 [Psychrobacillus psychrodurans]